MGPTGVSPCVVGPMGMGVGQAARIGPRTAVPALGAATTVVYDCGAWRRTHLLSASGPAMQELVTSVRFLGLCEPVRSLLTQGWDCFLVTPSGASVT